MIDPYICLLRKKAKLNSTIEDLDKKKDLEAENLLLLRDNVLIRRIQKSFIEALNVCPDDCILELQDIYKLAKMDLPDIKTLYKSIEDETAKFSQLKTFLAKSLHRMSEDM